MPCYDARGSECAPRVIEVPVSTDADRKRIDTLTRVCCDMRTVLRREGLEHELTVESRGWIAAHDEWDRRRIAGENERGEREETRSRALDKLTLEERRVLGL